ncbi:hypothetical protein FOZ63_009149, partial [Perkinsus olseni]
MNDSSPTYDARQPLLASTASTAPRHLTPGQRAKRRWMLVLCQTAYFVTITLLYQMAPFFPVYAKEQLGLTDATIGVVFAFLPCASCIMAPVTGYLLQLLGYFTVLLAGGVFVAIGTLGFGFSKALGGFLAFRAAQGVGAACTYSATSAIMARQASVDDIEKIFAVQELIGNVGFALGPTIGAGLFQIGGFHTSFIVLTIVHFGVMILMMATWVPIPPAPRVPVSDGGSEEMSGRKVVGVREVLRMRHILLTVLCSAFVSSAFGFMDPVLSEHFLNVLGDVSPATMGLMFAFPSVTMAVATLLIPKTTALLTKHVTLALGLLVMGASFLTLGPTIKVSSNPWVQQLVALGLAGIGSSWGWVPCMPYMIEGIPPEMGHGAIDMVSALFNGGASLGEALGPILGGSLTGVIGFSPACLSYAVLFLLYGALFWILAPDTSAQDRLLPYTDYDANPGISAARISRRYSTASLLPSPVEPGTALRERIIFPPREFLPQQLSPFAAAMASSEPLLPAEPSTVTLTPGQRAKRRWMLVLCQTAYFVTITLLYQMAPFFPVYAKEQLGLTNAWVGVVFAGLPLTSCLLAPLTGYLLQTVGHFAVLLAGGICVAVGTSGFGFSHTLPAFFAFRAIQGAGAACSYSAISAIMARLFPDDIEKVFAAQELIANLGFALGPTIGAGLFQWGGFRMPFVTLTIVHLAVIVTMMITWVPLPQEETARGQHRSEQGSGDDSKKIVGMREVLSMRHVVLTLISTALVCSAFGFMDPVLSSHFLDVLGPVSPSVMGLLFAFPTVTMAIVTPFIPQTTAFLTKRTTIALGLLAMGLFFANLGPTIKVSSNPWVQQLVALGLAGIGSSWGWVPCMPYMIEGVPPGLGHGASDMISALFNGGASFGEALGPLLGGVLTDIIGFPRACLGFSIIFFACGFTFWLTAPDTSLTTTLPSSKTDADRHLGRSSIASVTESPRGPAAAHFVRDIHSSSSSRHRKQPSSSSSSSSAVFAANQLVAAKASTLEASVSHPHHQDTGAASSSCSALRELYRVQPEDPAKPDLQALKEVASVYWGTSLVVDLDSIALPDLDQLLELLKAFARRAKRARSPMAQLHLTNITLLDSLDRVGIRVIVDAVGEALGSEEGASVCQVLFLSIQCSPEETVELESLCLGMASEVILPAPGGPRAISRLTPEERLDASRIKSELGIKEAKPAAADGDTGK